MLHSWDVTEGSLEGLGSAQGAIRRRRQAKCGGAGRHPQWHLGPMGLHSHPFANAARWAQANPTPFKKAGNRYE